MYASLCASTSSILFTHCSFSYSFSNCLFSLLSLIPPPSPLSTQSPSLIFPAFHSTFLHLQPPHLPNFPSPCPSRLFPFRARPKTSTLPVHQASTFLEVIELVLHGRGQTFPQHWNVRGEIIGRFGFHYHHHFFSFSLSSSFKFGIELLGSF